MVAYQAHNLEVRGSSPLPATIYIYNMGETEKVKKPKPRKSTNTIIPDEAMTAIVSDTIRGIIRIVNEEGIRKENIVSLLKENGQFILVYFE